MRKLFLFILFLLSVNSFSQTMSISGSVSDTVAKRPLQYAVAMATRIKDSVLVAFARTDASGKFEMKGLPIDTVQVTVSNPAFGDLTYYVFGSPTNNVFDFGKMILPPKSQQLKEVVIYAFKDPVFYKGDTLIYTADSFKVKPNATVEDLLKKLPGIRVDAQGKITSQGKKVEQVLVDGDEFFGADPTIATKNLNANTVESVQVYEKKNDNATADGADETIQVMNLKLKDDAKKGYFGKVSGASDFQKFYEGEFLANRFKNKQKVSVFALATNTPRNSFGWNDTYKYGLDNEYNYEMSGEGDDVMYTFNSQPQGGIPRTLKSGFYYNDKLSKNTKINLNYTYSTSDVSTKTETTNQYFLSDTTYKTKAVSLGRQKTESHSVNFFVSQKIDSLTDLEIKSSLKYNPTSSSKRDITNFLSMQDTLGRSTDVENTSKGNSYDLQNMARLTKRFKKKDRLLLMTYNYNVSDGTTIGGLKSSSKYYTSSLFPNDSINQQKQSAHNNQTHIASIVFTEPITPKIKLEFSYDMNYNMSSQNKKTLDYSNGDYNLENSLYTNSFRNERLSNRAGARFIYEIKKYKIGIGARARQVSITSTNLVSNVKASQTVNNILPYLNYRYNFSQNKTLRFDYSTTSDQPTISQLQPVPDNTNPNQIKLGNANLTPNFNNRFNLSFNSYKPISGKYIWASASYNITNHDFTNSVSYDSLGRTSTQTVNVNGNYNGNGYLGAGLPFFSKKLEINPSMNGGIRSNTNFINGERNITKTSEVQGSLEIVIRTDSIELTLGGNYDYNVPYSTINKQNNKPYSEQQYNASFSIRLPYKFRLETNAQYNIYSKRTAGYNIDYVLWNASLIKTFFKKENMIVSVDAVDLLNQNTNTKRLIQDNVITDTKTNIIGRYIMVKLIWKFNSNKTKEEENDGMF